MFKLSPHNIRKITFFFPGREFHKDNYCNYSFYLYDECYFYYVPFYLHLPAQGASRGEGGGGSHQGDRRRAWLSVCVNRLPMCESHWPSLAFGPPSPSLSWAPSPPPW